MKERVRNLIKKCNRIVVLSGLDVMSESGLHGVRQEDRAYEIEEKFGYSPEEIAATDFLNRRVELFYRFYKEEILDLEKMKPTPTHYAIAELEKQGKLSCVVTRTVYGLHQLAGIQNIIELHGNVNQNLCIKCGRIFPAEYIKKAKGVPVCETCRIILKPGFSLFGETVDNGKISKVAEKVAKADMVIVLGASLESYLCKYALQYYRGDRLVLIRREPGYGDKKANYFFYGKCSEILPELIY